METNDKEFMSLALSLAKEAAAAGESPIGAVIVKDGKVIASAHNRTEEEGCATAHAEMLAIKQASEALGTWRLTGCTLYVTMEPCPMCAGAICHSRVDRVVYGVKDARAGAFGSVMQMNAYPFHPRIEVTQGVMAEAAREILQAFFEERRK